MTDGIEFDNGRRWRLSKLLQVSGPVWYEDATKADLIATLQANPQLRASVLDALLPDGYWDMTEIARLRAAESELARQLTELQGLYAAFQGSGHSPKNSREAAQAIGQMHDAESELAAERARVAELERELTEVLCFAPRCKQCGKACEPQRWVYAVPTCYSCLPPPAPIEEMRSPQQPSPPAEPQQQGERVMPVCAADNCGLPCNDLTAYRVIRDGERFDYCCVECAIGHARSLGEASAEEAIQEVEAERDELRRKLEEALARIEEEDKRACENLDLADNRQRELMKVSRQLQAAEAELVHTREAAELLRDSCADGDLAFRLRLEQWASRDQKRAATTEEQAAPAAVELPGGKGPDYVTRAKLAAALRKLAMCRDADTAPRHIAWQNLANELEAKGE